MRSVGYILSIVLLAASWQLEGQIRIVPRQRLDSVVNPATEPCRLEFQPLSLGELPEQGGIWHREITWRNGESRAVVITAVKSSCGCLWADFSSEPVKAGTEGCLTVNYNPKGHPGAVEQRLFVYTNLSATKPSAVIRLTGRVVADADRAGDYPYACGALLLRSKEVHYEGGAELRVACLNGGAKPLKIVQDRYLCPAGVEIETEPAKLAPGQEGDLVIRFDERFQPRVGASVQLCFEGLNLPPRQRSLLLKVE